MTKLTLLAILSAKPGQEAELGRRLELLVAPTRMEAGCIEYKLHRSNEDPAQWMLFENWVSHEALDAHFKMPYLVDFLASRNEVLAKDMDIRFFTAIGAAEAGRSTEPA